MKVLREMEVGGNGKMLVVEVNGEVELRVKRVRRKNVCCGKRLERNEKLCEECKKKMERRVGSVLVVFGD